MVFSIPEDMGSNQAINNFHREIYYCQLFWNDKNEEKRGQEWSIVYKKGMKIIPFNILQNI